MSWHSKGAENCLQNAHFKYRWSGVSETTVLSGSSGLFWCTGFSGQGSLHCSVWTTEPPYKRLPNDCQRLNDLQCLACVLFIYFWSSLPQALRSSMSSFIKSAVFQESFESKPTDLKFGCLCDSFARLSSISDKSLTVCLSCIDFEPLQMSCSSHTAELYLNFWFLN